MALCLPREVDEAVEEVGAAQPAYSPQGVNSGSSAEYAGKSGEYAGRVNTVALLPVFPEYFSLGDTITGDKAKPGNKGGTCQESPAPQDWPGGPCPGVGIVMHPTSRLGMHCKQAGLRHNRLKQTEVEGGMQARQIKFLGPPKAFATTLALCDNHSAQY